MKLSKKDKAAILEAAELIATGDSLYSCLALVDTGGGDGLVVNYAKFYGKTPFGYWLGDDDLWVEHLPERVSRRILMILFFLEAAEDVLPSVAEAL